MLIGRITYRVTMGQSQRPTVGRRTRLVINWPEVIATLVVMLLAVALVIVGFNALAGPDDAVTVRPDDRVCVAMVDADDQPIPDAYYCGALVLTEHDVFTGQPSR